jgi:hypothetical protein
MADSLRDVAGTGVAGGDHRGLGARQG